MAPAFIPFVGAVVFFFQIASVKTDGKLFALGPRNGSQNLDLAMAQKSCAAEGARLASAEELRRAIRDCSFVMCTRGWLADGSIGTTLCNRTGSRLQSVKVIDVQLEVDPPPSGRYDAFCVKAKENVNDPAAAVVEPMNGNQILAGKPCGDPPSFPHSVLHGHTGFEMGDELHYVCAQGYVMSNKDAAFTLLCHTCGEWFGQVQACVKDETEGHIDYEDNFPDDRSMLNEEHNVKETEEKENEPKKATNDDKKIPFADGNNHIGVKMMYDEQGTKMLYESEDFPIGPTIVNKDTKAAKSTDSKEESWLDGYPVTQEAIEEDEEEEGDKIDGSMGMEDDISDQSVYAGVSKTGGSTLEKAFLQTGAVPSLTQDKDGIEQILRPQPTSGPENISVSKGSDDAIGYAPTASIRFATQELASVTTVPHLNLAALETSAALHLIDHIQLPNEEEMLAFPRQEVSTVPCQNVFTDTSADVVGDTLTYGLGGKPLTTFEPCAGLDCSSQDKGPMIATGVTLVCLLLLAAILAVWCFKKQQQKTSVYKLNGKDHTRHQLQQIEMQKV